MFKSLFKSSWNSLLRGDSTATKTKKSKHLHSDLTSEDEFIFIPNRKRSHVSNNFIINSIDEDEEASFKKEKPPSPLALSDLSEFETASRHVKFEPEAKEDITASVSPFGCFS